ncbi:hypothetical protein HOB10_00035 [Candidatus Parcubacteria bacterium]|jgi:hypothetical protein|nr:hypothetical protein [Candidatus Parcubacteria bacterium]
MEKQNLEQGYDPVPSEELSKDKKNWLPTIGGIVLFLILVGGGIFWWLQVTQKTIIENKQVAPHMSKGHISDQVNAIKISVIHDKSSEHSLNDDFVITDDTHILASVYYAPVADGLSETVLSKDFTNIDQLPLLFQIKGNLGEVFENERGYYLSVKVFNHSGDEVAVGDLISEFSNPISMEDRSLEIKVSGLEECGSENSGGFCTSNTDLPFSDSYFLTEEEIPDGFELMHSAEVEDVEQLTSAYGNANIDFVDKANIVVYAKPDFPKEELGVMIMEYKTLGALNFEVKKIEAASGYENIPLTPPEEEDEEEEEDEPCDYWGCDDLSLSKINLSTVALIGARDDSIYLRHQNVLFVVWSDSIKNESYAKEIADTLKNKINSIEEIIISDRDVYEKTFILKDKVYHKGWDGEVKVIARSTEDPEDPVKNHTYYRAKLSPNKKFILLGSKGWEQVIEEIYEISSGEIHKLEASSSEYGNWLEDNKIRIEGECGMGISCGIFESINNEEPWELEKVADYK